MLAVDYYILSADVTSLRANNQFLQSVSLPLSLSSTPAKLRLNTGKINSISGSFEERFTIFSFTIEGAHTELAAMPKLIVPPAAVANLQFTRNISHENMFHLLLYTHTHLRRDK